MAVSFIGGGNRSTRRKPPPCRKSMTNIMLYTSLWSEFELTPVVIGTSCIAVVVNPTTVRLRLRRPALQRQWCEGAKKDQHSNFWIFILSLMLIRFSSLRFQGSQKEPKPKFIAIFPLNVIVIIISGIWQGVKIGQIPKSNLCHCFSIEFLWKCNKFCCFLRFRDIRGLRASSSPVDWRLPYKKDKQWPT